jgi:hypothetical protein
VIHPKTTGTPGTAGTTLNDAEKTCPGTKSGSGTNTTMTRDDLVGRLEALVERMRGWSVPASVVPPVPAPVYFPRRKTGFDNRGFPSVPPVPEQNDPSVFSYRMAAYAGDRVEEAERWRDAFGKRAAVQQNEKGLSRTEAEAAALLDMATRWRNENPLPASDRSACCHCGGPGPDTPVLADAGHAWLHQTCWAPMNEKRQREALDAVTRILNAAKTSA